MRIGELAQRAGVSAQTVRYYERIGILPGPDRTSSGYRRYAEEDAARLAFITRAKLLGMTLEEIGDILRASGPRLRQLRARAGAAGDKAGADRRLDCGGAGAAGCAGGHH